MDNKKLMEFLDISDKNSIWLKGVKTDKFLPNNPYQLESSSLFNSKNELCDDILAQIIRGEVVVDNPCHIDVEKYEKYYFLNENLEIKVRKNKNSLVDYNNILIGNVFKKEEDITEKEKERLISIIEFLKRKQPLFTAKITDDNVFEEIRQILEKEKTHKLEMEKSELTGVLKKASFL